MRRKFLRLTSVSAICFIIFSSYTSGPGTHGYDCTGAETGLSNPTGCGSGCHGSSATAGITVAVTLDSAGIPVTSYKPGLTYTIKISGTNTTAISLPKHGFQVGVIKGATSVVTPVNAGTLQATGLPTGLRYRAASAGNYVVNVVEHLTQLAPASGTGGSGTVYADSFTWVAPVAGTGAVSIWGVLNAVNNNGNNDAGDKWNTNHLVVNELVSGVSVNSITANFTVKAYPNPCFSNFTIECENSDPGQVAISVYSMDGKLIAAQTNGGNNATPVSFNSSGWKPGMYVVTVEKNGHRQVIPVVKN